MNTPTALPHDVLVDIFELVGPEEAKLLEVLADESLSFEPLRTAVRDSRSFQAYVLLWDDHVLPPTRIDAFALACRQRWQGVVRYLIREAFACDDDSGEVHSLREVLFCSACREGSEEIADLVGFLLDVCFDDPYDPLLQAGWVAACGAGNEHVAGSFLAYVDAMPKGFLDALFCDRARLLDFGGALFAEFRQWKMEPESELHVFKEVVCAGAAGSGRFLCDAWEIDRSRFAAHAPETFRYIVQNGHFRCAQWFADEFGLCDEDFRHGRSYLFPESGFYRMAESDPFPFVEWLFTFFDIVSICEGDPSDPLRAACVGACAEGRLDILEWLRSRYGVFLRLTQGSGTAWYHAVKKGHANIVRAILSSEGDRITPADYGAAIQAAATRGHLKVLRAIVDHLDVGQRVRLTQAVLYHSVVIAAANEHMECAKLLQEEFDVGWLSKCAGAVDFLPERAFGSAAKKGRLDAARWLADVFHMTPPEARRGFLLAKRRGHADVVAFCQRRFRFAHGDFHE